MRERDKSTKKTLTIAVNRNKMVLPKVVLARSFFIRSERVKDGLIEILFETDNKAAPPERVVFDGCFLKDTDSIARYTAALPGDPDDTIVNTDIAFSTGSHFTNILQVGHVGSRAETCFSILSLNEWGTAIREGAPTGEEISLEAAPVLAVYSNVGFQKKLLSEILRVFVT
jgi:hypothetical protein